MQQRPVAVVDCLWQARLQRKGTPQEHVEYRAVCLLSPSAPAVAAAITQIGSYVRIEKPYRRQDVLREGRRIAVAFAFSSRPADNGRGLLRVVPTGEQSAEATRLYGYVWWKTAEGQDCPGGMSVFLGSGSAVATGRATQLAAIGPCVRFGLLLVDLEDVKGLRCGGWRLRKVLTVDDPTWAILAPGRKAADIAAPNGWEGWEARRADSD